MSSITTLKNPEDLENNLNNDFYLFINFYLKLEIMSIQKYIFDLIFYLMKVGDTSNTTPFQKLLNESLSTGVVISSIVHTLDIATKKENTQSKKDLFSQSMANFGQHAQESKESAKILEKLLESLIHLLNHHKFYSLFMKNEGIRKLIELHKNNSSDHVKLLIAKIIIKIVKNFGINYSSKYNKK